MQSLQRSNIHPFKCHHIQSLTYCPPSKTDTQSLTEDVLEVMVQKKWFGKDKKNRCLARQREANDAGAPLSCLVTVCGPPYKKYLSVYESSVSYYSILGRVVVRYDSKKKSRHCSCAKSRESCIHKYVATWQKTLFRKTQNCEGGHPRPFSD